MMTKNVNEISYKKKKKLMEINRKNRNHKIHNYNVCLMYNKRKILKARIFN